MKNKIVSALLVVMMIITSIAFTGCADKETERFATPENKEPRYEFTSDKTLVRQDEPTTKRDTFASEVKDETTEDATTPEAEGEVTEEVTTPEESGEENEVSVASELQGAATEETTTPADGTTTEETTTPADGTTTEETTTPADGTTTEETTTPSEEAETDEKTETEEVVDQELKETVFKLVDENENYEFYFCEETLEFALKSKKLSASGEEQVWYSNPAPAARAAGIPGEMSSQLSIFYLNKADGSQKTLESYTDCFLNSDPKNGKEQYFVVNHNGNLRVIYILGLVKPEYVVPTCMDGEMAQEYIQKFKDANLFQAAGFITNSTLYTRLKPSDWAGFAPDVKKDYLAVAPNIEEFINAGKDVYIILDQTKWNNARLINILQDAFIQTGMTLEMRDEINANFGFERESAKTFWIPVDYALTKNGLNVTIPVEEIQYDKENLIISSIDLLKYFGSASEKEEGYMFVPDGSGAIINFNNGKTNINTDVRVQLYGLDDGRETLQKPFLNEGSYLPVFGIKRAESAMFAIIESGDTNATIIADISGKNKNAVDRNTCFSRFKMAEYEEVQFKSAGKTAKIYQNEINTDNISVTYSMLLDEKANYSGMAEAYRNYLIDNNVLTKKAYTEIPFNIELVGAYDHETAFLGIPYTETKAITTFDQCAELLDKLNQNGIKNVSVNYKGWANSGIRNTVFNEADVLSELGGEDALKNLLDKANSLGMNLYFETELALVYASKTFDGYSEFSDASRLVTRQVAYHYQYLDDWNTAAAVNQASIVTPALIYDIYSDDNSESFAMETLNDIKELNINGVSLGSLGYNLPGNYKVKDLRDRGEVADTYAKVAEEYKKDVKVMAKGTNSYMLPYVDTIFEISNTSSKFNLADQSVPFYQMVIHGYVEYSGDPINLYGDTRQSFLQAVEAGSGMYYRWCYAPNEDVQDLWFEGMYSLHYGSWFDEAIEMYKEYNDVLKSTAGAVMTEHENLDGEGRVNKVTYDNGVEVYVNYGSTDYTTEDGTVVKAESFCAKEVNE